MKNERSIMKVVVIGGSGLIGSKLITKLGERGRQAVAAAPSTGVNTVTGEGLAHALAGAQVVVDVANSPSWEDNAVLAFFETSGRNLLAAEAAAGVGHHGCGEATAWERTAGAGRRRGERDAHAAQWLAEGQQVLDLGLEATGVGGGPLEITGSRAGHLRDALWRADQALGFDGVHDGDAVLRDLVLARIIEPTSKLDAARVLTEAGVASVSCRTNRRRLPVIAKPAVRQVLSVTCASHAGLGPASLVLFDVTTRYFETDTGAGFREPGFSNYAAVAVMPRSWRLWWCCCCSTGSAG